LLFAGTSVFEIQLPAFSRTFKDFAIYLGESSLEKSMAVDYFHRLCPTVTVIGGWHENRFRDFHWGGMRRRSLISVSLEWILLMDPTLLFSTSFPSGNYPGIGPLQEEREEIDKWSKVPGGIPGLYWM
jgi:hypothetical protein